MGAAGAAVLFQRGGDFAYVEIGQGGFDHHFGGELHASGAQVQAQDGGAGEAAQAAMEIAHRGAEEQATDGGQHRIADIAVVPGHGAGGDAACEPIAHDQIGAITQSGDKGVEIGKIITVVGIAHDDETALGGGDATGQGGAIAFLRHIDEAGAIGGGDSLGAIGGAIIGNEDFAGDAGAGEERLGLGDADGQCFGLVEAGHQNGEFEIVAHDGSFPLWPARGGFVP